jgi:hypothetical protein
LGSGGKREKRTGVIVGQKKEEEKRTGEKERKEKRTGVKRKKDRRNRWAAEEKEKKGQA